MGGGDINKNIIWPYDIKWLEVSENNRIGYRQIYHFSKKSVIEFPKLDYKLEIFAKYISNGNED